MKLGHDRLATASPPMGRQNTAPLLLSQELAASLSEGELRGPTYPVNIYGMKTRGVIKDGGIWYAADPLFPVLHLEAPEAMIACWPDELACVADNVPGCTFLLTRVGLLRLISHGTSPKALEILTSIAHGLTQFFDAEKVVHLAETSRREDLVREKLARQRKEEEQLKLIEQEREAKKAFRREKRSKLKDSGSKSPSMRLESGIVQDGGKDSEEQQEPTSFRSLIRQSLSVHNATIIAKQEVSRSLRQSRADAVRAEVGHLPDQPVPSDASEAVIEEGTSYLQADPTRVVRSVVAPTEVVLTMEQVFSGSNGTPAMTLLSKHFARQGRIDPRAAKRILRDCKAILTEEPNCVEIEAPCHVFGDIHGQYFDLHHIINKAGHPFETKQLWLGDYVDRGAYGCEVTLLLCAAKIKWPKHIFLLRGNHETRGMAQKYNFEREALAKYAVCLADFYDCFDSLPLAAVVRSGHGNFFCVHGGLGSGLRSVWDVNNRLERFSEPEMYGPTCDLLWSDPVDESHMENLSMTWTKESIQDMYFDTNYDRGCGQIFGPMAARDFLEDNEMVCVIRAHEVQKEGWKPHRFFVDDRPVPMVITVFSAPNYLGSYENKAAFLTISDLKPRFPPIEGHPNVSLLGWIDAPYDLPGGGNIIQTTMPMVAEAVLGFFLGILQVFQDEVEDEETLGEATNDEPADAGDAEAEIRFNENLKNLERKVASLRVERQEILEAITPLSVTSSEATSSADVFQKVQALDQKTEIKRF